MEARAEAVDSAVVLASAAGLVAAGLVAVVLVVAVLVAEVESPVAAGRRVEAAQKAVCPGSGSQRPRCCAGDLFQEAARLALAAVKAAFPFRKKTCAPCSVCSRSWVSRARIPKRAWKYPHFNRA